MGDTASPSFAQMLAHMPSDPNMLFRSGSLGPFLAGSGGSLNLLMELGPSADLTGHPEDGSQSMVSRHP